MATTTDNATRALEAVKTLRAQHAAGLKAVTKSWPNAAEKAVAANMKTLGAIIDTWSTTRRAWAAAGGRNIGATWSAYSWERWFGEGVEYATAIKTHTGAAYDANFFTGVVAPTARATTNDVVAAAKSAVDVAPYVLAGVGVVLVVVGLVYLSQFVPRAAA